MGKIKEKELHLQQTINKLKTERQEALQKAKELEAIRTHFVRPLVDIVDKVSSGEYEQAHALFEFTKGGPPLVRSLAEAFSMMMVKVEGREFRLEQTINELKIEKRKLEEALQKIQILENIKNQLGKYVPVSVKNYIENNPDNPDLKKENIDVTVLFIDIAGYSKMSEKMNQAEVNYIIQTYFSSFLDVISKNEGDINETAGDGCMVIFQNPEHNRHAINAVRSAITIQEQTDKLNLEHFGRFEPIRVNIGINSGSCSVGSTKYKGITSTRYTFTASGSVTNLAARILSKANNGEILVGSTTYERVNDKFNLIFMGNFELKNISTPQPIYKILT